jgi:hypothetical protein
MKLWKAFLLIFLILGASTLVEVLVAESLTGHISQATLNLFYVAMSLVKAFCILWFVIKLLIIIVNYLKKKLKSKCQKYR